MHRLELLELQGQLELEELVVQLEQQQVRLGQRQEQHKQELGYRSTMEQERHSTSWHRSSDRDHGSVRGHSNVHDHSTSRDRSSVHDHSTSHDRCNHGNPKPKQSSRHRPGPSQRSRQTLLDQVQQYGSFSILQNVF